MKKLEDIYKGAFFGKRYRMEWRAEPVCSAIIDVLNPQSIIDIGCAVGDLIKEFDKRGRICYGIEGAKTVLPHLMVDAEKVFIEDLRVPINPKVFVDLVLCLEVAEHIEPEYSNQFVDNLIKFSHTVLLTAAPPGQGGHYHVNCQPFSYWINKFALRGYYYYPEIAESIKKKWLPWKNKKGIKAYYDNLLFFKRRLYAGRRYNNGDSTPRSIVRDAVFISS